MQARLLVMPAFGVGHRMCWLELQLGFKEGDSQEALSW